MNKIMHIIGRVRFVYQTAFLTAQIVDNNSLVAKGAKIEKLGSGYSFTEGPAADKDGNVYFTDQPNNKILK